MYYIYNILNKINNKFYIGITNDTIRRFREHKLYSKKISKRSYPIHRAINKYGISNFLFEIIDDTASKQEAQQKEILWIKNLKDLGFELYNLTNGGEVGTGRKSGFKLSESHKKKLSERNSGSGNPMYGVQLFGEANGHYGKAMKSHVKEILLACHRKLTDEQIKDVKELYATGNYTQTGLAEQFKTTLNVIHRIVHGKSKAWGDKDHNAIITKKNITKEEALKVRELYDSKQYTAKEIGAIFNISETQVYRIGKRLRWKDI